MNENQDNLAIQPQEAMAVSTEVRPKFSGKIYGIAGAIVIAGTLAYIFIRNRFRKAKASQEVVIEAEEATEND